MRSAAGRAVYATKAFLCRAMARLAHEEGMLLDVASGGELHVALSAGVPADTCTMHGNNKSVAELRTAIEAGRAPHRRRQLRRARPPRRPPRRGRRSGARRAAADHAGRARPHPRVHRHRSGRLEVRLQPGERRRRRGRRARQRRSASVNLVGLHCHIGSNVFAAESFGRAAEVMAGFARPLDLPELVLGGGLGVAYVEGEEAPTHHRVGEGRPRHVPRRSTCARR